MGRTAAPAPTEEGTIQETVALCQSERTRAVKALTTLQPRSASMANRATVGFLFSVTGGAYQIISPYVAAVVDRNSSPYYYVYSFETLILTSFLVFWGREPSSGRLEGPNNLALPNLRTRHRKPVQYHHGILHPKHFAIFDPESSVECYAIIDPWTTPHNHWRNRRLPRSKAFLTRRPCSPRSRLTNPGTSNQQRRMRRAEISENKNLFEPPALDSLWAECTAMRFLRIRTRRTL